MATAPTRWIAAVSAAEEEFKPQSSRSPQSNKKRIRSVQLELSEPTGYLLVRFFGAMFFQPAIQFKIPAFDDIIQDCFS